MSYDLLLPKGSPTISLLPDIDRIAEKERYVGVRKPGSMSGSMGFAIAVEITVKQALLDVLAISSSSEFDGIVIETPIVGLHGYDDNVLFCETKIDDSAVEFGIASFNTKHTGMFEYSKMKEQKAIPISFYIPFRMNDAPQSATKLAVAYNSFAEWADEILSGVFETKEGLVGKPISKSRPFESTLFLIGSKTDQRPVGKVYYHASMCILKNVNNASETKPDSSLIAALSGTNAENVANHIFNMYASPEIELADPSSLLNAVQIKESINPVAFYTVTDLITLKAENPISNGCVYVKIAGEQAERAVKQRKFLSARQWEDEKSNCEERVIELLNISSTVIPSEFGNIGNTWVKNLLWDIPYTALEIDSPVIAGHDISVDILFDRWNTKYTNWCWGLSCCFPSMTEERTIYSLWNTPASAFWCNLLFYLIFLGLSSWLLTSTDPGLYHFHTGLVNQFVANGFVDVYDDSSFWYWANSSLGDVLFSSNLTELVGNVTFRQFRVHSNACPLNSSAECFSDLDLYDLYNLDRGGSWDGTEWHNSIVNFGSIYGTTPSGGYAISAEPNQTAVTALISNLQDSGWIDDKTRIISVQFAVSNPDVGLYALCVFSVEWSVLGVVFPSYFFYLLPVGALDNPMLGIIHALVTVMGIGYLLQEVYEFASEKNKLAYLGSIWNLLDFILFFFYLVAIWMRYTFPYSKGIPSDISYNDLFSYWFLFTIQISIEAIFLMFLWFRLAYFFRASQYAGSLLVITIRMIRDILYFVSLVLIVVLGAALLMAIVLRSDYDVFQDFATSLTTLAYSSLGHGDFLDNTSGGTNIQMIFGNVIYFLFFVVVTILLINLLIAILNGSYTDLKDQATGIWALQFAELLQRCESELWPPPLNIIAFVYYGSALLFCPHLLRSYIIHEHPLSDVEPKRNGSDETMIEQFSIHRNRIDDDSTWVILTTEQKVGSPRQKNETLGTPEEEDESDVDGAEEDNLHLQIINETDEIVDIFLHYSESERYFLVSLLPLTCIWFPSIPVSTVLSAHFHENISDKFFNKKDNTVVNIRDPHYSWKLSSEYNIGFSDKVHPHDLIYSPTLPLSASSSASTSCDTCSIDLTGKPVFHCCKNCSFSICTACFYEFRTRRSIPSAEEELCLVVEGERWWGEEIKKPKISYDQNPLVKSIVEEYLDRKNKKIREKEYLESLESLKEKEKLPESAYEDYLQTKKKMPKGLKHSIPKHQRRSRRQMLMSSPRSDIEIEMERPGVSLDDDE